MRRSQARSSGNGWLKGVMVRWAGSNATRRKSVEPQQVLPGARSLIMLTASYT